MRLPYVCSDFGIPPAGTKGASIHLRAITRALADAGHEMLLLSPLPGPGQGHPTRRLLADDRPPADESAAVLKVWLTRHELDSAVAREFRSLAYNAWAADRAVHALRDRPPDAVLERLSLFGHIGLDLAERFDVPLIVEVNALLTEEARRYRSLHLQALAEDIERRVLRRADALTIVSDNLAGRIAELGVVPENIQVIPNGADVDRFSGAPPRETCRAALGLTDEFVVGFVGSLKAWHGVDVLVDAFSAFRPEAEKAKLLIVGSGPTEADLRDRVQQRGLADAVVFAGAVPHEEVPTWLRAMDVAAAPFLPTEGFYFSPIKLFEYMAAGACVVASDLGQIREVIRDGANGVLCTAGDVGALSAALRRAHGSPAWCRQLADRALEVVRQKYTWRHTAARTAQVVQDAIRRRENTAAHCRNLSRTAPVVEVTSC